MESWGALFPGPTRVAPNGQYRSSVGANAPGETALPIAANKPTAFQLGLSLMLKDGQFTNSGLMQKAAF
jgi:hypothetical protein